MPKGGLSLSYADDCYEGLMIEESVKMEAVESYIEKYSNQKVVEDALGAFKKRTVDESSKLEQMAREILKTVARMKTLSAKQKKCLVRVLVYRHHQGYET